MNKDTAIFYENIWRQGGIDAIENFALLQRVVETLHEGENIVLDYNQATVTIGSLVLRWI